MFTRVKSDWLRASAGDFGRGKAEPIIAKISRDARGNDRDDPAPRQLLHEQIQKLGFIKYNGRLQVTVHMSVCATSGLGRLDIVPACGHFEQPALLEFAIVAASVPTPTPGPTGVADTYLEKGHDSADCD